MNWRKCWVSKVKLGEVCEIISGSTPKTAIAEYWNGSFCWITPAELSDSGIMIIDTKRKLTQKGIDSCALTLMPVGTVLLSSRAPIGKVAIAGVEMYCNQGFKNLVCSERIYNHYLYWFLKSKTDYLNSLGRGATFKEISKSIVENIEIPLPEIKKQMVISNAFDRINYLILMHYTQLKKLDELVKSRFVEMFGDINLAPQNANWTLISEIGDVVGGSTPKTSVPEYWNGEYRWISPAELKEDPGIIYDSVKKITKSGIDSCSLQELPVGTVILSSRAPIGKVAIAGNSFYCNQGFKNIICNEKVLPRFLYTLLLYNTDYLNSLGRGATFKEISKPIVENIRIPLPTIELQQQFIEFVTLIDKSKLVVKKQIKKLETLNKSLMQEFFG